MASRYTRPNGSKIDGMTNNDTRRRGCASRSRSTVPTQVTPGGTTARRPPRTGDDELR